MENKPTKKNQETELLQERIIKLEKQLESFKHSNDHFLKNKLFLHYDIKEPEKVVVDCETKLPVLVEIEKKKIQKGKESDPTHLLLEGDNYHALSVLNYTHVGKIDLIYIDPPYNTKSSYFIYNDKRVDREDSFTHSKWLAFMDKRLRLAKKLLADTGVIFISIDDNEQAHLRLLCDQIFGQENFVANLSIENNPKGRKNGKFFSINNEYCLVYAKNYQSAEKFNNVVAKKDLLKDEHGEYTHGKRVLVGKSTNKKVLDETIKKNYTVYYNLKTNDIILQVRKLGDFDKGLLKNGYKVYQSSDGENLLENTYTKDLFVTLFTNNSLIFKDDSIYEKDRNVFSQQKTLITTTEQFDLKTETADFDMGNGVLLKSIFNNPKNVSYIEMIIKIATNKSGTILDFFAGSGTTGHAVLKLNAQDGGTRQFILCSTNDEKEPIVDKVLYPRIKKVINGYGVNAPIPANLRYFQTDFVEKIGSPSQLKIDLTRRCAEMLCVKENVFDIVKLKKLTKNYKFFKNDNKYLCVFFDFFTDLEFVGFIKELNALPKEAEKVVYVFVLDGSAGILADEFSDVANCVVKEIPQKILDIYKQLAREVARK